jgi:hypothetical protein
MDGVDNVLFVDCFLESQKCLNVFWLVVWNIFNTCYIFPYFGLFIIPTDFHIFQRGRSTTNQNMFEEITVDHMGFWWGSWRVASCPCLQAIGKATPEVCGSRNTFQWVSENGEKPNYNLDGKKKRYPLVD